MLNRLIRALGESTFFNNYLVSLSFFFKQNLLFPEFICLKSPLITISKTFIIILLEIKHLFLP